MASAETKQPVEDTRTRILHAAGPVFAEKGFEAATVREICQLAEVNVASISYHFGDKERLYIETVQRARYLRAAHGPMPTWTSETPPEQRLRDFILMMAARMLREDEHSWPARLMLREVLQPTAACRQLVEEYFRPHFELLLGILSELLPEATPPFKRRQLAYSIIGQCLYYRAARGIIEMLTPEDELKEHYQLEQLAEHVASVMLAALGRAAPFGTRPPDQDASSNGQGSEGRQP